MKAEAIKTQERKTAAIIFRKEKAHPKKQKEAIMPQRKTQIPHPKKNRLAPPRRMVRHLKSSSDVLQQFRRSYLHP
jgi:uncharacterized protein (DUF4415 family)